MQNVLADLCVESQAATVTLCGSRARATRTSRRFSGWRRRCRRLQASLLLRHGDAAVAAVFCASRLGGEGGRAYGTLQPDGVELARIVVRRRPRLA